MLADPNELVVDRLRKIIHIDADSFYASVERREQPQLAGRPIAVGGSADRRGVIATCSYEARKFGIHSAMSSARATQLCPDLLIIPPRFELYRRVSGQFREIFNDYTERVEPLSLDEAFLDVSDASHCGGSATLIAQHIRERIKRELKLTVSAGIAPNKFLAKVASDWNKPDGQLTISPQQVAEFVSKLPVSRINGVGKVTAGKLKKLGVETCGDLQQVPLQVLLRQFGKYGRRLSEVAQGIDNRAVQPDRIRKSISVERTFNVDIPDLPSMLVALDALLIELQQRFGKISERYFPVKRFVKIKYKDFTQTTLEEMMSGDCGNWNDPQVFHRLLHSAWPRGAKPVRLLGAGLRLQPLKADEQGQLSLFS